MTCDGCFWLLRKDLIKNWCDLPDDKNQKCGTLSPKELRKGCKYYVKETSITKLWERK